MHGLETERVPIIRRVCTDMEDLLVQLPVHLQSNIVLEWLADWKCTGNLDSAVCNRTLRPSFHHMLQSTAIPTPMPVPSASNEVAFVKWITQRRLLVKSVQIGSLMSTEKALHEQFLAITGTHITTFRICGSTRRNSEWSSLLFQISIHCGNLERLCLESVDPAEGSLVSVVFVNCKRISHFSCHSISETVLRLLVHYCPHLTSLQYSRIVSDDFGSCYADLSPLAHLANLRVLIAPQRRIAAEDLITYCPLLEELSTGHLTCGELDLLSRGCPHILSFCTLLTSRIEYGTDTVAAIVQHWPSARCLSFESIHVDYVNVMSDSNLLVLVGGCKNLQHLHVGGVHKVNWKDERLLAAPTSAVHTSDSSALRILLVDKLEPHTLNAILSRAPDLQSFAMKLNRLQQEADRRTLEVLAEYQVKRLCLGEEGSLTDAQCTVLAGLRELQCRYVDHMAACSALIALAKRCPELDTLALQLPHGLVKQLPKILLNCPNLRTLAVTVVAANGYSGGGLTDKELLCACFKAICTKLVHIDLSSK